MTQEHPITPTPDLVLIWDADAVTACIPYQIYIATQAAQWGADQELEACISAILDYPGFEHPELFVEVLRAARRPKLPSLKEQALEQLKSLEVAFLASHGGNAKTESIRRALDALPD